MAQTIDKYDYDRALEKLRKEYYTIGLKYRILESAEFDIYGDFVRYEEEIPLTETQLQIVWNYQ